MSRTVTVAAVQAAPAFLDREDTIDKACALVDEAAHEGARLVVLPEAFVPGYPEWVWRTPAWRDGPLYQRLWDQAVTMDGPAVRRLGEAAADARSWVAIGVNERDPQSATLYNTLLYLAPDGSLAGYHRKLMPTGGERTVWGSGDGSTLTVIDTDFGRLGGLICWENYMPLARAAMYAQGVHVYLAPTWDSSDAWIATLRHIAKEGRVFVIGTNICMRTSDVGEEVPQRGQVWDGPGGWLSRGNTAIVGPDGDVIAGPLREREAILYADLDLDTLHTHRREFDPVGHYARPDVFHLQVDVTARTPVTQHAAVALAAGSPALSSSSDPTAVTARSRPAAQSVLRR